MNRTARSLLLLPATVLACCGAPAPDPSEALLGGDTTIMDDSSEAFNYVIRNASPAERSLFQLGDNIFTRNWMPAPGTVQGLDGLGPTFIATSCSGCHDGDGRGEPPMPGDPFLALFLRLSIPGTDAHGGPLPEPNYGDQIQNQAIQGVPPEATPTVSYVEVPGTYADGEAYSLRKPTYAITNPAFGPLAADVMVSPRIARQLIGLGLLQAVSEDTILGFAKDGGHPNYVWDIAKQGMSLGRFGWKASQPTTEQQTLLAFYQDIGVTSKMFTMENCPPVQTACVSAPQSLTQPNLPEEVGTVLAAHGLLTAVPARRHLDDPQVQQGERVFMASPCPTCHKPQMVTGVLAGYPELSNQTIRPYTDLLLHDMGPGLADGRPDYMASGSEWRTPPLWGIGLIQTLNDHSFFLNDGRARGFAEAILWHDGEGAPAREAFRNLSKSDREALLAFLQDL